MSSIVFINLRVVRKSIVESVTAHFEAPPTAIGWSRPYNVYDIQDMANPNAVLTDPYVFVISEHAQPTPSRIPMVVVDTMFSFNEFQLGSRSGCDVVVELWCWGRDRPERDDMASMLANVYAGKTNKPSAISIWTSMTSSKEASTGEVSQVSVEFPTAGGALSEEGTLRNWAIASFRLRVK